MYLDGLGERRDGPQHENNVPGHARAQSAPAQQTERPASAPRRLGSRTEHQQGETQEGPLNVAASVEECVTF